MEIKIRVSPESSSNKVAMDKDIYIVKVKAKKKNNEANEAVIDLLAKYLDIPRINIRIKRGKTSKNKILEIL